MSAWTALQIMMMPRDANPIGSQRHANGSTIYDTVFGGVILSHIDMAGAMGARREVILRGGPADLSYVTVAINRVEFKQPVLIGDVVRFETELVKIGRTSITIHIQVVAERGREVLRVTEAEVVYVGVSVDAEGRRPTPLLPEA